MKKSIFLLAVPFLLQAETLTQLFDALKHNANTKEDTVLVEKAKVGEDRATSELYPRIDLFGKYDHYSKPTGMLPVPPNELFPMIQNQNIPQPFSTNIYRMGASLSMPIFIKSIYTTADKSEKLQESAKAKKRINQLKHEAVIVGSNANLQYLEVLSNSLESKKKSLLETLKSLQAKVDNGRAPGAELYKIRDSINEVEIVQNSIRLQREKLLSSIESLTGIRLDLPVAMRQVGDYGENSLSSLDPLRKKVEADAIGLKAEKEKRYPSLVATGNFTRSYGKAYNNNEDIYTSYSSVGVVLNIPLLAMSQYADIDRAALDLEASKTELERLRTELIAQTTELKHSLPLYESSIALSEKSIADKEQLLAIAKVNFNSGRLSTEEYLRYEDALVEQKAKLYANKAKKWQSLMALAVIYANNIEEIVK